MAVRHGYGKVATDGLVFAYDTGDTVNSYKGRPTTNHFPLVGTVGKGAAADNYVTFPNKGTNSVQRLGYGQTFGGYTIKPEDAVYKFDNVTALQCAYFGGTATIPVGAYVTFTFEYLVSSSVTIETGFLANIENYGNNAFSANPGTISDSIEKDVWHKIKFTAGPKTTNAGTQAMLLYPGGCSSTRFSSTPGYILYKNPMVEFNTDTIESQYTSGTRSATEGLLDLTGNRTIDLNGVSFDANAMIDFDGTDDFLVIPNADLRPGFTLETVCYPESGTFAVWGQGPTIANRGLHIIATTGGRGFVYGMYGNDCDYQHFPTTNAWHHWVFTYDGTTFQKKFFADGVAQTPSGNTVQNEWIEAAGDLRLGTNYGSGTGYSKANGKIAVAKYYNRPLTDDEIVSNFNHYKTRFGI